ncbi:hypothetical protein WG901_17135 [Novosphingobium sp. PS1R-30]|uniref:Uncharacterized protein n=1 Tax=Novosphingobium anseongense TaxID=3133436 RepID=A0ABU8RZ89_9SPHN|nr:MAG: hypothetical protein EOO76_13065 [Novosphingobium sp.]
MSFATVLLTPFVLLFPAAGTIVVSEWHEVPSVALGENPPGWPEPPRRPGDEARDWVFREFTESFRVDSQNQVRIEQNMSVRIAPLSRPMTQPPPQLMLDFPRRELAPRMVERNIGRCLPVASISGVQADSGSRLILYLRDRRMISATLDRACRARDFYSGFYLQRTTDGQICADRDTLLSRSGANCKLTRIRQLVQSDD